jgi:hypothetical protein
MLLSLLGQNSALSASASAFSDKCFSFVWLFEDSALSFHQMQKYFCSIGYRDKEYYQFLYEALKRVI